MTHCPVCTSSENTVIASDRFDTANRYLRCRECGCGFSELRVQSAEESARLHTSQYYTPDNEGTRRVPAAEAHFLSRLRAFVPAGRLLDIGCGRGHWLHYIRRNSAFEVEGIELSDAAAQSARSEYGLRVNTCDLASAAYPDASFDVVYLRHVLEHIADPRAMATDIRRILAPGGICAVHVPNDASITNALKRRAYRAGLISEFGSLFYPLHVTGFTPSSLDRLFSDAGFTCRARETISKVQRTYEFPRTRSDIPLLPAAALELVLGRGNLLLGWYGRDD